MNALIAIADRLAAVLCDPEGRCVIAGTDADREHVNGALEDLRRLPGAVTLRPLAWDDSDDESTNEKGFHIERAPDEADDPDEPWRVVWGEGEPDWFRTREDAKAEADEQWRDFVTDQLVPLEVDEAMETRYLDAVHGFLGTLTATEWEDARKDKPGSLRKAARIGLKAALGVP